MLKVIPPSQKNKYETEDESGLVNVFDGSNESGNKVIKYLFDLEEKYNESGRDFLHWNQPTIEAYNAEIRLIRDVTRHSQGSLDGKGMMASVERFIKAHDPYIDLFGPGRWTGSKIKLYSIELLVEDDWRPTDSHTCTRIQCWIIAAYWTLKYKDYIYHVKARPL